jgi:two-component system OmpR family response regulator
VSRILVVEDERHLADGLRYNLEADEHEVDLCETGEDALRMLAEQPSRYDLVVLDVMLPGIDGFAVVSEMRQAGQFTPTLMLTARGHPDDVLRGFGAGADDYLAKPFAFGELTARLRALTRRGRTRALQAVVTCGPLEFDQRERSARVNDTRVDLSATELRLLEYLLIRRDRVVPRDELMRHVWDDSVPPDSKVVEVYVSYLRKKLGVAAPLLRTIRGMGYILTPGPQE